MRRQTEYGFSLIELLIVVAIIGIIAAIAVPMLMEAIDRSKQRRSMGDMRTIAAANGTYIVDQQNYAPNLAALVGSEYLQVAINDDGWGNAFQYAIIATGYELRSLGADGAVGPAPPAPWANDPFEPDLIVTNGQFTQFPDG